MPDGDIEDDRDAVPGTTNEFQSSSHDDWELPSARGTHKIASRCSSCRSRIWLNSHESPGVTCAATLGPHTVTIIAARRNHSSMSDCQSVSFAKSRRARPGKCIFSSLSRG